MMPHQREFLICQTLTLNLTSTQIQQSNVCIFGWLHLSRIQLLNLPLSGWFINIILLCASLTLALLAEGLQNEINVLTFLRHQKLLLKYNSTFLCLYYALSCKFTSIISSLKQDYKGKPIWIYSHSIIMEKIICLLHWESANSSFMIHDK